MDKEREKSRWAWVPAAMPGVARLMAKRREEFGAAWVATCWSKSMAGEPGWFFAREGALAIGTPWDEPEMANFGAAQVTATQALVLIRKPEAGSGTD